MEWFGIWVCDGPMKSWYRNAENGEIFADTSDVCAVIARALIGANHGLVATVKPLPLRLWPQQCQVVALIEAVNNLTQAIRCVR